MSVTKATSTPVFTAPPVTQSPIDVAADTLKANAAQLKLECPRDYNVVKQGSRSIQIWIPGGATFGITKAAFEKIFAATGCKAERGEEYGNPVTIYGDPNVSFLNRISYTFQVDGKGGIDPVPHSPL